MRTCQLKVICVKKTSLEGKAWYTSATNFFPKKKKVLNGQNFIFSGFSQSLWIVASVYCIHCSQVHLVNKFHVLVLILNDIDLSSYRENLWFRNILLPQIISAPIAVKFRLCFDSSRSTITYKNIVTQVVLQAFHYSLQLSSLATLIQLKTLCMGMMDYKLFLR